MAKAKRKGRGKNKGNAFEREFCRTLSEWWTNGERDDIFWRSASSGGFATRRTQRQKTTSTQHGDIAAIDPIGHPLMDLMTIELKRGYSKVSPFDLIDKPDTSKWKEWVIQASRESKEADAPYWLIVHRRDNRQSIVCMPSRLCTAFASWNPQTTETGVFRFWFRRVDLTFMELDSWLKFIDPAGMIALGKKRKGKVRVCLSKPKRKG